MERFKTARPVANLRKGRTDWYRITNSVDGAPAQLMIYDEIGYFGVTAGDFVRDMQGLKGQDIELHLNSPGGDVFAGIAIYNALKDHNGTVTTIVDGLAASAASFIAMAGDRVVMSRKSQMMIHDAHGLCIGNAADMKDMVELLDKNSDNIASIYAEKTGGTVAQWRKVMKNETWYTDEEAVKAGLADEVKGNTAAENSWDLSIFNFAGREKAPEPVIEQNVEPEFDAEAFRLALQEVFQ